MAIPGVGGMGMSIGGTGASASAAGTTGSQAGGNAQGAGGNAFGQLLSGLTSTSQSATDAMNSVATGGSANLSDVTLSVQMESLAFDLAVQIRNRLVDAYNTVFQMQV